MKSLVFFQLNEVDFDFIIKNSKKFGNKFNLLKNTEKILTETEDSKEGFNLDPWVQWVSINSGIKSRFHKVYNLGQKLNRRHLQIWDKLSKNKINFSVWCSMNANLRSRKYVNFFLPDPWNFSQKSYPNHLEDFLALPKYFAQNYKSFSLLKIFFLSLRFLKSLIKLQVTTKFLKELPYFFFNIFKFKRPTLTFYLFLDLILLEIITKYSNKNNREKFSIIFINSIAHFQHNYWDDKSTYKLFFFYLNKMFIKLDEIKKKYDNFLIGNGLSQTKIKPIYICKISDLEKFFIENSVNFKAVEPNMTTGGTIFFKNIYDKKKCIIFLSKFSFHNQKIFFLKNFKKHNKLYFRFDAILNGDIQKLNYKNYKNLKIGKRSLKKELIKDFNYLFRYISFIKSTSVHDKKGILYHSKFIKNYKKIENHEINNLICKYFNF
tara:strand:+ start:867 stop:2168 length:1302 start_codon:yes stop_codon:yes gene_type:complete